MELNLKYNLFLDDFRLPKDVTWIKLPEVEWHIAHDFRYFVNFLRRYGCPAIVSLDHDLHPSHNEEAANKQLRGFDYDNVNEKTGLECAIFLVRFCKENKFRPNQIYIHTLNPVGGINIQKVVSELYKP